MIISIDNHVGLPFLEGLCDDLQAQIRQRREAQTASPSYTSYSSKKIISAWQFAATRIATVICAFTGGLAAVMALLGMQ